MFALNIVLIVLISYEVSSFIPHTTRLSLNSFSRRKQGPKYNWQSATTSINGIENGRNGGMNGGNGLKGVVNGLDGGVNGGVNGGNVENEGNRGHAKHECPNACNHVPDGKFRVIGSHSSRHAK